MAWYHVNSLLREGHSKAFQIGHQIQSNVLEYLFITAKSGIILNSLLYCDASCCCSPWADLLEGTLANSILSLPTSTSMATTAAHALHQGDGFPDSPALSRSSRANSSMRAGSKRGHSESGNDLELQSTDRCLPDLLFIICLMHEILSECLYSFVPLCVYMYILAYLATCHLYILVHNTAVLTNLSMVHSRPMVWNVAIF